MLTTGTFAPAYFTVVTLTRYFLPRHVSSTGTALAPLANVCDTNYSALTKISKSLLPAADAYGGMHRQLRDRARSL